LATVREDLAYGAHGPTSKVKGAMDVPESPIDQLERLIIPYYVLHQALWERMIVTAGADGWRAVAAQHYYVMKAAVPLLEFAAGQARAKGPGYDPFVHWCLCHAEEEHEHPLWFLEDLVAIGCDQQQIVCAVPEDEILDLLGAQFALAATAEPAAILGFFFTMEAHPSDAASIVALSDRLGIPKEGLRTILFHAEEDLEHAAVIRDMVERYGHGGAFPAMCRSAVRSLAGWTRLFYRYSGAYSATKTGKRVASPPE
jgi:Iron-containing redox enzyme